MQRTCTDAERHARQARVLRDLMAKGTIRGTDRDDSGNSIALLVAKLEESASR